MDWIAKVHVQGVPRSMDSWRIVLNVFFHILYFRYKRLFPFYFEKQILYSNIFYFEINFTLTCNIFSVLFSIKELNKLWKKTFRIIYHVYWDTLYVELVLTMDWIEIEEGVNLNLFSAD